MDVSIGVRIRTARQYRGLTQAALAERMGMTRSALAMLERPITAVSGPHVRSAARALAVDARYLLGLTDRLVEGASADAP